MPPMVTTLSDQIALPDGQVRDSWGRAWASAARRHPEHPLVPVCMWCQRVAWRADDQPERWEEVPAGVRATFRTDRVAHHLTHGLCPECLERHYPTAGPTHEAAAGRGEARAA